MNDLHYHKSLATLHEGCEEPHAYFVPYQTEEAAKEDDREKSDRFASLCGEWKFRWFPSERELGDFLSADFDKTFAEATMEEKNAVSHRARAIQALLELM